MVKEDIIAGLQNAIERGFGLQSAVQSFLNAGYNTREVNEAAQQINMGIIGQIGTGKENNVIGKVVIQDSLEVPAPLSNQSSSMKNMQIPQPSAGLEQKEIRTQTMQKLPTQGVVLDSIGQKKKMPIYLIILIIIIALVLVGLGINFFYGEQILDLIFK